jgi:hypothetical protein
MTPPAPITLFGYIAALTIPGPVHPGPACDALIPGGCERCHAAITSHNAYSARFGTVRCRTCIGTDGFATAADLELFRQTGTLPCSGCGQPAPPSQISPDGSSYTYHCHTCGTTARYTMPTVA